MKKSPKHVLKASTAIARIGDGSPRSANEAADLHLDKESVALFSGIHASKEFTAEAAHRAFAGVKRRK